MGSPEPALTGLSARAFERTLGRLSRLREDLEGMQRVYAEREDLPGIRTLVGALLLVTSEGEREVVRRARTLYDNPGDRAELSFRGRVGGLLNSLERLLPAPLDVARRPHGRQIEALVGPFTELALNLSSGQELIFEPGDDYEFDDALIDDLIDYADNLSLELANALRRLPRLTVITYPAQLDGDTLLHAAIGHELAHLALDRIHTGDPASIGETLVNASIDERYDDLIEELRRKAKEEGKPTEREWFDTLEEDTRSRIKNWFAELACDSLALRMIGPAYLFALIDLDLPTNRWAQKPGMPGFPTHPGLGWRATRLVPEARGYFPKDRDTPAWVAGRAALDAIEACVPAEQDEAGDVERGIIEAALERLEDPQTIKKALGLRGEYQKGRFAADLDSVWAKLEAGIPPTERILTRSGSEEQPGIEKRVSDGEEQPSEEIAEKQTSQLEVPDPWSAPMDWRSVLNGTYIYWLADEPRSKPSEDKHRTAPVPPTAVGDWQGFNEHVRGTIELRNVHQRLQDLRDQLDALNFPEPRRPKPRSRRKPAIGASVMLARETLLERLSDGKSGLALTPIVDARGQMGEASVDLRLGPDFVVARQATGLATFDPARVDEIAEHIRDYQDYVRRPPGSAFYLHPGEFAIARTFEYITLPAHTAAQVTGRSSWGRLGLVIATAPLIQPSFEGTITLELANLGTVPIVLYVGVRVAQVSFFDVGEPVDA